MTTDNLLLDTIRHKRGATLRIRLPLPMAPDGWDITAQLRGGNIVEPFDVRVIDPAALGAPPGTKGMVELTIAAERTVNWPIRLMQFDFRGTLGDEVVYSRTGGVIIDQEVTRP